MIITSNRDVTTNLPVSKEFTISEDASMLFTMLSNFLYTEKERSVITELCSNAVDAHALVGRENTPIHVTLPTELQKEFRVRDFGPGLCEDDVHIFLTKYGSSSKSGSNQFIGGFGIGSKSPAAVTDNWTVNSHHSGKMKSYLIHVNDRGIPSINKLFEKDTDESGIEVVIPTKTISIWHDAAEKALKFYDVPPIVRGTTREFEKFECDYKNELFYIHKCSPYRSLGVIINKRLYFVNSSHVNNEFLYKYILPFKTGELSVSLSREDLQYDKKTISAIEERIEKVKEFLENEWKNTVSVERSSIFKYQQLAIDFKNKFNIRDESVIEKFANTHNDEFKDVINYYSLSTFKIQLRSNHCPKLTMVSGGRSRTLNLHSWGDYGVKIGQTSRNVENINDGTYSLIFDYNLSFESKSPDNVCFINNDIHSCPSRAKKFLEDNPNVKYALILEKEDFDCIPAEFCKVNGSTLVKPVVVRTKKEKSEVKSNFYVVRGNHFEKIDESDIDIPNTVCLKFTKATTTTSIIPNHVKFYKLFNETANIVFIREGEDVPPGFLTPDDFVRNRIADLESNIDSITTSMKKQFLQKMCYSYYGSIFQIILGQQIYEKIRTPNTSKFNEVMDEIQAIMKFTTDLTAFNRCNILNSCYEYLNIQKKVEIPVISYEEVLKEYYPMLKIVKNFEYSKENFNVIMDYISKCGV